MSLPTKRFFVVFHRVGTFRDWHTIVEAPSLERLEEPIKAAIEEDEMLPEGQAETLTVTFEEASMKGQLNYGLVGEFTVSPM